MSYKALITSKAMNASEKLYKTVQESGEILEFKNKDRAQEYVEQLSAQGSEFRVQSKAKNDPRDINSYIVAIPKSKVREPIEETDHGMKFDTSANQVGSIGESLVSGRYGVSPSLKRILKHRYGVDHKAYIGICKKPLSDLVETEYKWFPDVIINCSTPSSSEGNSNKFACEVKTGNASFGRDQRKAMRQASNQIRVLNIRVFLEHLPQRYEMKVKEVRSEQDSAD